MAKSNVIARKTMPNPPRLPYEPIVLSRMHWKDGTHKLTLVHRVQKRRRIPWAGRVALYVDDSNTYSIDGRFEIWIHKKSGYRRLLMCGTTEDMCGKVRLIEEHIRQPVRLHPGDKVLVVFESDEGYELPTGNYAVTIDALVCGGSACPQKAKNKSRKSK